MKRILLLLTLSLFVNVALSQSTNNKKVKTEQKCSSTEKSNCAKKCSNAEKSVNKQCCSKTGTEKNVQMQKNLLALRNVQMQKNPVANLTKKQIVVKIKKQIQANAPKEMPVVLKLVKNPDCDKKR